MALGGFFAIAAIVLLSIGALDVTAGYLHKMQISRAGYYATSTQPAAIENVRNQLATMVQSTASTTTLGALAPVGPTAACDTTQSSCPYTTTTTFAVAGNANGTGGTGNLTGSLTEAPFIQANDVNVTVTTVIKDGTGEVLSTLQRNVTITLSLTSPYAYLSGSTDRSGNGGPIAGGDAMNCNGANPTSCDTGATGPADDTRIHALIGCQPNGGSGTCTGPQDVTNSYSQQHAWNQGTAQTSGWNQ